MFVGFLTWWYSDGLTARINDISERFARVADFFSVGLLAKTLFSPFRQLSTGAVRGSLEVQLRALIDNVLGRLIGAFVRSAMIIFAFFASLGVLIYGIGVIIAWLILPALPLGGLLLTLSGAVL
jgi:hypothetical protein